MSIQTTITTTQSALAKLGAKGEDLRLERSRVLVFANKSYSKDLKTFQGVIFGSTEGSQYNPKIIIGKGWTCTCKDHKNLLNGNRPCGRATGSQWAISPCKHVLSLARFGWVTMGKLSKQANKIESITAVLA